MSDGAAAGPSDRGAAMIMGHSTKQWLEWDNPELHPSMAQNAASAMQARIWKFAMLQPLMELSQLGKGSVLIAMHRSYSYNKGPLFGNKALFNLAGDQTAGTR